MSPDRNACDPDRNKHSYRARACSLIHLGHYSCTSTRPAVLFLSSYMRSLVTRITNYFSDQTRYFYRNVYTDPDNIIRWWKGERWDDWCQLLQVEEADKLIQNKSGRTKRQLLRGLYFVDNLYQYQLMWIILVLVGELYSSSVLTLVLWWNTFQWRRFYALSCKDLYHHTTHLWRFMTKQAC